MSLLTAQGWPGCCLKIPSNPNPSRIPFLYYFCSVSICIAPPAHSHWAAPLQGSSSSLLGVGIVTCPTFYAEQRSPIFHQLPSGRTLGMGEGADSIQGEPVRGRSFISSCVLGNSWLCLYIWHNNPSPGKIAVMRNFPVVGEQTWGCRMDLVDVKPRAQTLGDILEANHWEILSSWSRCWWKT